ncbi:glycosyltransferase involved in cell wall biosynthesis [Flavobacterium sp. 7E]|uniref:glycosyltransferase family 4 protein n=1 Tax=unclassified Flavobacterium TaxID=196869 RepID=UPI00156D45B9|nr:MULTISPECIES: glycosyltransferase family 4 protein [unclassified Flavobacterium]MBE0390484.1 N-acetyl-alpha-D-glucosaminyl L-malate synthase [Flavobacterium sp. PL002]NRS88249.1 glycosyltransferase involved in cell wall biosynthesis [Flavobacterium sp. 7E]
MTILHVSAVKNWGGGENHIENLCFELKNTHPEVTNIILCVKNGLFHSRLSKTDLQFETAPLAFNLDFRFSRKIIKICKENKVDMIHIHDPSAIALCIIADKFYNLPPFIFSKKTSFPIKKKKTTLYKYNYSKIKKYLCVSNETKRVTQESITDKDKLTTIYHGTNLKYKSTETPYQLREKFVIDPSKKIIGIIGNHIRAKNFETLIETVNIIINKEKRKDLIFIQIGNFTDRTPELLANVKKYKLENHIIFLGYTPNASNFIPQFDALLVTSQSEGIPQVIFESFYHKKPVISTNVGGIPEIIEHNINGLLSPKHDPKDLAKQISYLLNNPDIVSKFTSASYKKLLSQYTTKIMAEKTLEQYINNIDINI